MRSNLKEITKTTPLSIINLFNLNPNSKIILKMRSLIFQLVPLFPPNNPKINLKIIINKSLRLWTTAKSIKRTMFIQVMFQRILHLIILKSIMFFLNINRNKNSIINRNLNTILINKWFRRTNFNRRKRLKGTMMTLWNWICQIWNRHYARTLSTMFPHKSWWKVVLIPAPIISSKWIGQWLVRNQSVQGICCSRSMEGMMMTTQRSWFNLIEW